MQEWNNVQFLVQQAEQYPPPKDGHALIPGACKYVTSQSKRDFAMKGLEMVITLEYPGAQDHHKGSC